jgi:tRNA pseudouridine32 synthase/23S rRNA pseudouridine746 synthase
VIVHVDAAIVVADKPAGLLAVPGRGADKADCLWSRVASRHADARIVHRIDMATSGLVLFARGAAAQRDWSAAFAAREVRKTYVAVVDGHLGADAGEIDLPLAADWPRRPRQKVDLLRGKPSLTRWRVLDRGGGRTRLVLEPVTGRSHQLRVHLLAIGHAIVGDTLYAPPAVAASAPRLLLHAASLERRHPDGRPLLRVHAPPPF